MRWWWMRWCVDVVVVVDVVDVDRGSWIVRSKMVVGGKVRPVHSNRSGRRATGVSTLLTMCDEIRAILRVTMLEVKKEVERGTGDDSLCFCEGLRILFLCLNP